MSGITSIDPMGEYTPNRREERREEINPVQDQPAEKVQVPEVKAAAEQQDFKTTVQGFAYTGKGSFIDGVF